MANLTKAERDRLRLEAAREAARAKESDEQKWIRTAIREEIHDELAEILGLDDDDEGGKPKQSGGGASILDGLFGQRTG